MSLPAAIERVFRVLCCALVFAFSATSLLLAQDGRVHGLLLDAEERPVAGIQVAALEDWASAVSNSEGRFTMSLPAGSQQLELSIGDWSETVSVVIERLVTTPFEHRLAYTVPRAAALAVTAASARTESLRYAPIAASAVTPNSRERFDRWPVARALAGLTGGAAEQATVSDYAISTRGMATHGSERVAVRVDGRDPSLLFFGGQEWPAVAVAPAALAAVDFTRGPGSTVFAGHAPGGLLSLETRTVTRSDGSFRVGGGEGGTAEGGVRWAQMLTSNFGIGLQGNYRTAEGFRSSRNGPFEYGDGLCPGVSGFIVASLGCLPAEATSLRRPEEEATNAGLRLDYRSPAGIGLTFAAGGSELDGHLLLTDIGRVEVLDASHQWARFGFSPSVHWDLFGDYRARDAGEQTALATGQNVVLDDESFRFELQTRWDLSRSLHFTAGFMHRDEEVATDETLDLTRRLPRSFFRQGVSRENSLLLRSIDEERDALNASVDWRPTDRLVLSLGTRYDDASFHKPEWSPRASLVWGFGSAGSVRVGYARAFRFPNYSEYGMQFDIAPALQFASLEPQCVLFGVVCAFDLDPIITGEQAASDPSPDTRQLFLGNRNLDPEETNTLEIGVRSPLGERGTIEVGYHLSQHDDLIVGPIPNVGTTAGRINPDYQAYSPPEELPLDVRGSIFAQLQGALGPSFQFLSTQLDGTPVMALFTYGNVGDTEVQGADLGVDLELGAGLLLRFDYSWLDTTVERARLLVPHLGANAPENRATLGLGWSGERFNVRGDYRWVDDYLFASGPFVGFVDSYGVFDLGLRVRVSDFVDIDAAVANATDEEHWQTWGGDLLGRRAWGTVTFHW